MITQNAENETKKQQVTRPPIVVVLGHVDHGKSSLLEAIREDFKITAKESGGITQHMGAYQAEHQGKKVTFIDTPGHELFSAMRSRGAKVADVAVLVVAADESVKPQTREAIEQIKKANIPLVVAINKIDKPEAQAERVKQELAQHEVVVESYGGTVPAVETSAATKQGIKELIEMILLVAELENLQADPGKPATGTIIEAHLNPQRGPTATILVNNGTVRVGDILATNSAYGKIRILEDFQGQGIEKALPSTPAAALGLLKTPVIGEEFRIVEDEQTAQLLAAERASDKPAPPHQAVSPAQKTVNLILKADVAGSLEALQQALSTIPQEETALRVVEAGVGEVGENDVKLARSTQATILGFRTKISGGARDLAEKENVLIETFEIIYELIEKARAMLEQSAEEEPGRKQTGTLRVLALFLVDKNRQVIGGKVTEGEVRKGLQADIVRDGEIVGQGKATNVQRDKKDVPSVSKGAECGLSFEAAEKVQEGDALQFFAT